MPDALIGTIPWTPKTRKIFAAAVNRKYHRKESEPIVNDGLESASDVREVKIREDTDEMHGDSFMIRSESMSRFRYATHMSQLIFNKDSFLEANRNLRETKKYIPWYTKAKTKFGLSRRK